MNKKGFTMIELLAVVVLLGILTAIAVPSIIGISSRMRENMFCTKVNILQSAAKMYAQDKRNETYPNGGITIDTLITGGYIKNDDLDDCENVTDSCVLDPRDQNSMNTRNISIEWKNQRAYATMDLSDDEKEICK